MTKKLESYSARTRERYTTQYIYILLTIDYKY